MTEIDVPDWVVQLAVDEMTRVPPESEGQWFSRDIEEVMRACLTAALGAWVVPAGYRALGKPCSEGTQYIAYTHNPDTAEVYGRGGLTVDAIFTLRQEKPE